MIPILQTYLNHNIELFDLECCSEFNSYLEKTSQFQSHKNHIMLTHFCFSLIPYLYYVNANRICITQLTDQSQFDNTIYNHIKICPIDECVIFI